MKADTKSPTVDVNTLSKLFSVTTVYVQELARKQVIVKAARGRYELWPSIKGFIKHLQDRRANQWDDGEKDDSDNYSKHRSRLTKSKADMAEMQAEAMRGTFHEASAVEVVWTDMLMNCRSKLLAMPTRLAPQLRQESELGVVQAILETAITEALNELANYDPDRVTSEYIQAHRSDVDAAVEADGEPVG